MPVLLVEKRGGVATLTLNRPEALNALDLSLRNAIGEAFLALDSDPEVRVAILTGAGRAFSAGIDLKELGGGSSMARSGAAEVAMIDAIHAYRWPVIGAINGHAITGGFELALACDLLIASTRAIFGDTHARVGILPGWGLSQKLPRLIGISRAKEVSLSGNFVDAERAERWGLVNRVVEPEELLPACRALAEDMLSCDPESLRGYKRVIDQGYALPFAEGLKLEAEASRAHLKQVRPGDIASRRADVQSRGRAQQRRKPT